MAKSQPAPQSQGSKPRVINASLGLTKNEKAGIRKKNRKAAQNGKPAPASLPLRLQYEFSSANKASRRWVQLEFDEKRISSRVLGELMPLYSAKLKYDERAKLRELERGLSVEAREVKGRLEGERRQWNGSRVKGFEIAALEGGLVEMGVGLGEGKGKDAGDGEDAQDEMEVDDGEGAL